MSPQIHAVAMIDTDRIRVAFERNAKALTKRLSPGLKTAVSKARITDRLSCQTEEGPWNFTVDMPEQVGGSASGPDPGVFGWAAFGSCIAIGYVIYPGREGIPFSGIEVEVQANFDGGCCSASRAHLPTNYRMSPSSAEVQRLHRVR